MKYFGLKHFLKDDVNEQDFIQEYQNSVEKYLQKKILKKQYKYNVRSQSDVVSYFQCICTEKDTETVYCIFLNAKNRVITFERISEGTLTQCLFYPREIIKRALKHGALSIVIVHNHPSGSPTPSEADRKVTKKLLFACKEMDIVLLDHMVIGTDGNGYYSFYEQGLIEQYNAGYRVMSENQI